MTGSRRTYRLSTDRLESLRLAKGFSYEQLARAIRMSKRQLERIAAGTAQPYVDTIRRIAEALGTTPEALTISEEHHARESRRAQPSLLSLSLQLEVACDTDSNEHMITEILSNIIRRLESSGMEIKSYKSSVSIAALKDIITGDGAGAATGPFVPLLARWLSEVEAHLERIGESHAIINRLRAAVKGGAITSAALKRATKMAMSP